MLLYKSVVVTLIYWIISTFYNRLSLCKWFLFWIKNKRKTMGSVISKIFKKVNSDNKAFNLFKNLIPILSFNLETWKKYIWKARSNRCKNKRNWRIFGLVLAETKAICWEFAPLRDHNERHSVFNLLLCLPPCKFLHKNIQIFDGILKLQFFKFAHRRL